MPDVACRSEVRRMLRTGEDRLLAVAIEREEQQRINERGEIGKSNFAGLSSSIRTIGSSYTNPSFPFVMNRDVLVSTKSMGSAACCSGTSRLLRTDANG